MRRHRAMAADPENETARMLRARGQFRRGSAESHPSCEANLGAKSPPQMEKALQALLVRP
ncbi:hypothetical protein BVI434_1210013 [Burkholderia vietnamiensis]|nr:hypothetical protein BVI434_1210013 [Burkholderia vietnamiensis]